ncbi:hypothetical protein [Paenibacillus sanfengchensis]|uniref:hypothetical protein n=1 Tax=Paenibacillus sanfengchensis TaxID=3119819 RepID=UPI002FDF5E28
MGETWTASMNGAPWTRNKMNKAIKLLEPRAIISYVIDIDKIEDLLDLDQHVFAKRQDLILSISCVDTKSRYTTELLRTVAQLKHVFALKLNLNQSCDLSMLSQLCHLNYLSIASKKPINLDFVTDFKQLQFLSLDGQFTDLSPVGNCSRLDTLILRCTIDELGFVSRLPLIHCLYIHDCGLESPLSTLADSNIKILSLASIRNLLSLDALASLHQLHFLHLSLPKVEFLCDFSSMKQLKQLELNRMKSLKNIDLLRTAQRLESLKLCEISPAIKARDFEPILHLQHLRELDFRFIDFNKKRIAAMRELVIQAGLEHILHENIPEDRLNPSIADKHMAKYKLGTG